MTETSRIHVEHVTLSVPTFLQDDRSASNWLSTLLVAAFRPSRREWRTILEDISFDIRAGDRLAILGRNGAGKSTLLRVLNGSFHPTGGRVDVTGSRQALLNISLGFNGEATVRENVFLRGTAMGLGLGQMNELAPGILEFAGLSEKANHRLKTLSAGQRMRLGFSVSTCVQHDIMLMDEWLGTGDAEFIARAKARLADRVKGSGIVVLASHNVGLLKDVCNKGIVLEQGRMVFSGDIMAAIQNYHALMAAAPPGEAPAAELVTYGCLEEVALADGVLTLRGWAASGGGPTVLLGVDLLGERRLVDAFERSRRVDVQKNLGLVDADCGFRIVLPVPGLESLAGLRGGLNMFGGPGLDRMDGPFRVAQAVLRQLQP